MKIGLKMSKLTDGNEILDKMSDVKIKYPSLKDSHIKGFLKKK